MHLYILLGAPSVMAGGGCAHQQLSPLKETSLAANRSLELHLGPIEEANINLDYFFIHAADTC